MKTNRMTDAKQKLCVHDAVHDRYQFVCTPAEFRMRYGVPTEKQANELKPYVVVCKDGMIRPR